MPRKGWNSLSPAYKARLEKNGISKTDYESGASIQAARGHKATPERPSQANPKKHQSYVAERNRLIAKVTAKKHFYFGTSPKWNPLRAANTFKRNPPPMARLRYWSQLTKEEWLDAIRQDPDTTAYLGYH